MAFPFGAAPKSPHGCRGPPRRVGGSAVEPALRIARSSAPFFSAPFCDNAGSQTSVGVSLRANVWSPITPRIGQNLL